MKWIIDSDSHITEPRDVWTARVLRRFIEQVPHLTRNDDGQDVWTLNGQAFLPVGHTAPAGWPGFPPDYPLTLEDCHPASHDASSRLKYLDENGIWAQVLFPNVAGFGNQEFLKIPDPDVKLAAVRAYNDFLDDWTSADKRRLLGILSIPFWDIDATTAEVARCLRIGHPRGILFTGEPQRFGLPPLGHEHWDPLYALAEETGLPLHFHIGGGEDQPTRNAARLAAHGYAGTSAHSAVDLFMKNGVQCADLILSGVLQRFPSLKFVSVESGIGWIPFMLEAANYSYLGATQPGRVRTAELLPSELFQRQVYGTYWFEQVAPQRLLDEIPTDNVLFETDFPHTACLYGNIQETIDRGLATASPQVRQKFLWDNAAALYHVDDPAFVDTR